MLQFAHMREVWRQDKERIMRSADKGDGSGAKESLSIPDAVPANESPSDRELRIAEEVLKFARFEKTDPDAADRQIVDICERWTRADADEFIHRLRLHGYKFNGDDESEEINVADVPYIELNTLKTLKDFEKTFGRKSAGTVNGIPYWTLEDGGAALPGRRFADGSSDGGMRVGNDGIIQIKDAWYRYHNGAFEPSEAPARLSKDAKIANTPEPTDVDAKGPDSPLDKAVEDSLDRYKELLGKGKGVVPSIKTVMEDLPRRHWQDFADELIEKGEPKAYVNAALKEMRVKRAHAESAPQAREKSQDSRAERATDKFDFRQAKDEFERRYIEDEDDLGDTYSALEKKVNDETLKRFVKWLRKHEEVDQGTLEEVLTESRRLKRLERGEKRGTNIDKETVERKDRGRSEAEIDKSIAELDARLKKLKG